MTGTARGASPDGRGAHGSLEIAQFWFAGRVPRTPVGTEAIALLLRLSLPAEAGAAARQPMPRLRIGSSSARGV